MEILKKLRKNIIFLNVQKQVLQKLILYFVGYSAYTCATPVLTFSEVFVVKSKEISSYALALDGFKSIVSEKIIEFDLKGDLDEGSKIAKIINKSKKSLKGPIAVFTIGILATKVMQNDITETPVIFCMVINPIKNGCISAENFGGVSIDISPYTALSNLKKVIPDVKNVGVIFDSKNSSNIIREAEKVALSLNLNLIEKEIGSEKEVPDALEELIKRINVLWLIPDSTVLNRKSFRYISTTVMENKLPVMACSSQLVKMGLPFSFHSDEFKMGRQAGILCQKVLNGEITENIPVESPQDVNLAINLITMEKFGVKISEELIDSAKEIYK